MYARFLIPLAGALALSGDGKSVPLADGVPGRFALLQGVAPGISQGNAGFSGTGPAMFRIDSATGRAWVLQSMPASAVGAAPSFLVWVELEEMSGERMQGLIRSVQYQELIRKRDAQLKPAEKRK